MGDGHRGGADERDEIGERLGVYALVVVPALGLGGIAVIAAQQETSTQQSSDPVADAARKARDQKKAEAKPKKVYTNDDLGGSRGSSAQAPLRLEAPATAPARYRAGG